MSFGDWLQRQRKALGLTQDGLAQTVGCSKEMLRKIEAGTRRPSQQIAERLAGALNIAPEQQIVFVQFARMMPDSHPTVPPSLVAALTQRYSTGTFHNNLPTLPTALIGREREQAAIRKRMARDRVRLLTLMGSPGIGKTHLALQVATDLVNAFDDGVCFVSLAPISDAALVAATIAQALGVRESSIQPLIATLKAYLSEKQLLLILDNFEHVLSAAPLVSDILAICPFIQILVTSRAALHIRGENRMSVPTLKVPDITNLHQHDQIVRYDAVQLFLERAQAVDDDFIITDENAKAVANICHRLEGLPLAIELAAARVKSLPPPALLARLSSRLTLLTGGPRDLPPRQQTLRNTIEWSYNLLGGGEQQLFRRLAIFVGGRTSEAVEAVCNVDGDLVVNVLDGLQSLLDKSLLYLEGEPGSEPRFMMLETIWEYAREQLVASGEEEALRRAHTRYYLTLVEQIESELFRTTQKAWLDRLDAEHNNLRAALERDISDGGDHEAALRMSGALWRFWEIRGHLTEGRRLLAAALVRESGASPSIRAKALNAAGNLARDQGDYIQARKLHEEALALRRNLGNKRDIANSLNNLGNVAYSQEDYVAARPIHEEALALRQELGDSWGAALSLNNLGRVLQDQGEYIVARSLYEESLTRFREAEDSWGIALALSNLGSVVSIQKDYTTARGFLQESLTLQREMGDKRGIAYTLNHLGDAAYAQGDYATARVLYKESLILWYELDNKSGIAESLKRLATVASSQDKTEQALRLATITATLQESIAVLVSLTDRDFYEHTMAIARAELGEDIFASVWGEGRKMSLERAIAYALDDSI